MRHAHADSQSPQLPAACHRDCPVQQVSHSLARRRRGLMPGQFGVPGAGHAVQLGLSDVCPAIEALAGIVCSVPVCVAIPHTLAGVRDHGRGRFSRGWDHHRSAAADAAPLARHDADAGGGAGWPIAVVLVDGGDRPASA